jgi:hypothetical protein
LHPAGGVETVYIVKFEHVSTLKPVYEPRPERGFYFGDLATGQWQIDVPRSLPYQSETMILSRSNWSTIPAAIQITDRDQDPGPGLLVLYLWPDPGSFRATLLHSARQGSLPDGRGLEQLPCGSEQRVAAARENEEEYAIRVTPGKIDEFYVFRIDISKHWLA